MDKQRFYQNRQLAYDWLKTTFPNVFGCDIPIKAGIHRDVLAYDGENKPANIHLRRAITLHVNRIAYLKCLKEGNERVDLEGLRCGQFVDKEQALIAKEKKRKLNQQFREKENNKAHQSEQSFDKDNTVEAEQQRRPVLSLKKKPEQNTV